MSCRRPKIAVGRRLRVPPVPYLVRAVMTLSLLALAAGLAIVANWITPEFGAQKQTKE